VAMLSRPTFYVTRVLRWALVVGLVLVFGHAEASGFFGSVPPGPVWFALSIVVVFGLFRGPRTFEEYRRAKQGAARAPESRGAGAAGTQPVPVTEGQVGTIPLPLPAQSFLDSLDRELKHPRDGFSLGRSSTIRLKVQLSGGGAVTGVLREVRGQQLLIANETDGLLREVGALELETVERRTPNRGREWLAVSIGLCLMFATIPVFDGLSAHARYGSGHAFAYLFGAGLLVSFAFMNPPDSEHGIWRWFATWTLAFEKTRPN